MKTNAPPFHYSREVELKASITFISPFHPDGTREVTHFHEIQQGERREGFQSVKHIVNDRECCLSALAVSKFLIPPYPCARWARLPLEDEAGAVEALDEHSNPVRVILHPGDAERLLGLPQPFSHP